MDRDRDVDRDRDRDRGVPEDWIEHRRDDGELLGWIVPEGEEFTAVDRLGRAWPPTDWFGAESRLEDRGLGYLAEPFALRLPADTWIRVRIVEVSTAGIVVKEEDYGDVTRPSPRHRERMCTTGITAPVRLARSPRWTISIPRRS